MKQILLIICFVLAFAFSVMATDFYASTTGTGSTCSLVAPCDLATIINDNSKCSNNNIILRGGTYFGKFNATITGPCVVRSYCSVLSGGCAANPSEWAIIDGNYTTTLNGAINTSQTTFTLADASHVLSGGANEIWIDDEVITIFTKSGNNITNSARNADGTIGGAASHANGATVHLVANYQLFVTGDNVTYRDFEVTSSLPNRVVIQQKQRGLGIQNTGNGNSFINLIVHDNISGILTGSSTSNTLLYGCLIYNNGMKTMAPYGDPPNEPRGINLYLENASGYSRVYDVLSLNGFTGSAQMFGVTGPYVGGDIQGYVGANAGGPVEDVVSFGYPNTYIGTTGALIPSASVDSSYFWLNNNNLNGNLTMGYGNGVADVHVTNSIMVGASTGLEVTQQATSGVITGNKISLTQGGSRYVNLGVTSGFGSFTWNNNTYYGGQDNFTISGIGSRTFAQWKTSTGWDSTSTAVGTMPDTVVVRPNTYETGRANIIVFGGSNPTAVNVNLSTTGLVNGQAYVIKNAFNWYGSNVATGIYNSGIPTISVPLNTVARTVASPTGLGYTPVTTCPQFCVMVVEPTSAQATPAVFTGSVKMRNVIFHN